MAPALPSLIPQPRSMKVNPKGERLRLGGAILCVADRELSEADRFSISLLKETFRERAGTALRVATSRTGNGIPAIRFIHKAAGQGGSGEAYRLEITAAGIDIESATERGRYHAVQTLRQLLAQYGSSLPCLRIDDAPDFAHRGFMHDVSRGKVPRLRTLFELVELLGFLKYNQLQLYIEHTFAFERHPLLGRGHSPLTPKDIRALDAHCRRHHIELVPNLQSFGHAAHTLNNKPYHHLAESEYRGGWTLSPEEPGTYKLLRELYEDFLPHFSHRSSFNVGCDETYDLGKGKSAARAAKIGLGRVYLGHLLRVRDLVREHGHRMMFWGDIIAKYPELLPEIPKDVVLLNWEYEAGGGEREYRRRLTPAKRSGLDHWICPGTSSWNSFFFRKPNARINLRDSAKAGLWAGASGYLVTDWGDFGHYNFLSYSLWPIAYGADCAWRVRPDSRAEAAFDERFALQLLGDRSGRWVEPLRVLGDLYRAFGIERANNSAERWLFTGNPEPDLLGVTGELTIYNRIRRAGIERALRQVTKAQLMLERLRPETPRLERIRDEWMLGARLTAHACRRILFHNFGGGNAAGLKKEIRILARDFESLWLTTNRPSDLTANLLDFKRIAKGYTARGRKPVLF